MGEHGRYGVLPTLRRSVTPWAVVGLHWLLAAGAIAACPPGATPVAVVAVLEGSVSVNGAAAGRNQVLCPGDSVATGARSRAVLRSSDGARLERLGPNTSLRVQAGPGGQPSVIDLLRGAIKALVRGPADLDVNTAYANAAVEGTEFLVELAPGATRLTVFEGRVVFGAPGGVAGTGVPVGAGEAATASASAWSPSGAPAAGLNTVTARPRNEVDWILYFPPLGGNGSTAAALRQAEQRLADGDAAAAAALLEDVAADGGRTDAVRARAAGLLAVIDIARNRAEAALTRTAAALDRYGSTPGVVLARSYALQATLAFEQALAVLEAGAATAPADAMLQARLAEMRLANDDRAGALRAADAAVAAAAAEPAAAARARAVRGFARLAVHDSAGAQAEFEAAQALAVDPLAFLGMGLARIRANDLPGGIAEISLAVILDPTNALYRAYLGKAYFERERRPLHAFRFFIDASEAALAATQLDIAKTLDPQDPTPWFYDAIRLHTANRPVPALAALEAAQARNDNRAVYRSELLLDQDESVRGISVASVYRDLGFDRLALVEGYRALATDPGNASAHRFLADTYARIPRHEIGRVSELLQAQLRQPINAAPVAPQLAETNLFLLETAGPGQLSFNEFTPVFSRNGMAVQANALYGSNDTAAFDLTGGGVLDWLSGSIGHFHYETDGFRDNNDINQDITAALIQAQVLPSVAFFADTRVQVEFRDNHRTFGDLSQFFAIDSFRAAVRNEEDLDTARVALFHQVTPGVELLMHYTHQSAETRFEDLPFIRLDSDESAGQLEGQLLWTHRWFDVVAGAGMVDVDRRETQALLFLGPFAPALVTEAEVDHNNAHVYATVSPWERFALTLGVSQDWFSGGIVDRNQTSPKLGLVWEPLPGTTLRAAAFRTFNRTLVGQQTLEPTQVAGFNQFFSDPEGSRAWRYGAGLDQQFGDRVFLGVEYSERELAIPLLDFTIPPFTNVLLQDTDEELLRAYAYTTLGESLAIRAEFRREKFQQVAEVAPPFGFAVPGTFGVLRTNEFAVGANWSSAIGLTLDAEFRQLDQDGELPDVNGILADRGDEVSLLNIKLRYRFPRRLGALSLELLNALDDKGAFQQTDLRRPRFLPEATIYGRLSLFFR